MVNDNLLVTFQNNPTTLFHINTIYDKEKNRKNTTFEDISVVNNFMQKQLTSSKNIGQILIKCHSMKIKNDNTSLHKFRENR